MRHALLRFDDVGHAVGEDLQTLPLRAQHLVGEDRAGMIEDASEIADDEAPRDAVAEPARKNFAPLVFEIGAAFEATFRDERLRIALRRRSCGTRLPAPAG
jgi:hypothetical protein